MVGWLDWFKQIAPSPAILWELHELNFPISGYRPAKEFVVIAISDNNLRESRAPVGFID